MARAKTQDYNATSFLTLTDIEGVKSKPEIYVGAMDSFGLWVTFKEPLDNAIDEAREGNATLVYVERLGLHEFIVYDNGRGIPIDLHPKEKVPAINLVFCKLHAGAKMNNTTTTVYKKSVGVHGMGAAITNALSVKLTAYTYRKGWHDFTCIGGAPNPLVKTKLNPASLVRYPKYVSNKGTFIKFTVDAARFDGELSDDTILNYLEIMSDFYPGITLVYADDKGLEVFYNKKKIEQIVAERNCVTVKQVLALHTDSLDAALCFSRKNPIKNGLHVCGSPTPEGGTHWNGLVKAVEIAIEPYVKKSSFSAEDIAESLSGVINVSLSTPRFKGQTKQRLESKEAFALVRDALKEPLTHFFAKNKAQVAEAIKHAEALHALAVKQRQETELVRAVAPTKGKLNLPPRLVQAPQCPPENRELYIVEGESALGSAKLARMQKFQEILPLTGKILNVTKNDKKAAENASIQDLLRAVGYDVNDKEMTKARVRGKIIFLTDADSDGGHIQLLLLGFLQKYMPKALELGMVHLVDIPLYSYKSGTEQAYGNSIGELKAQLKSFNPSYMSRSKGWGACSPAHLRTLAFADTRKLVRIEALQDEDKEDFYGLLKGDSALRRQMLYYNPLTDKKKVLAKKVVHVKPSLRYNSNRRPSSKRVILRG